MSNSVRPHRWQPTRLRHPWDSPGKNTGVGCHFLLQCMKVKSESEVAQLCPTLSNPMDCSLPGSSIHGIFQARVLEWGVIKLSYPTTNIAFHELSNHLLEVHWLCSYPRAEIYFRARIAVCLTPTNINIRFKLLEKVYPTALLVLTQKE